MATNGKSPVIVVLQLTGGNDHMNTMIPYNMVGQRTTALHFVRLRACPGTSPYDMVGQRTTGLPEHPVLLTTSNIIRHLPALALPVGNGAVLMREARCRSPPLPLLARRRAVGKGGDIFAAR